MRPILIGQGAETKSGDFVVCRMPGWGTVWAAGNAVPSDGELGFATGCIYQHLNGGVGSALYFNIGTVTSCNFDEAGTLNA
jgi:hypothetical protein